MSDREILEGYRDGLNPDVQEVSACKSQSYMMGFLRGDKDFQLFSSHPPLILAIRNAVEEELKKDPHT